MRPLDGLVQGHPPDPPVLVAGSALMDLAEAAGSDAWRGHSQGQGLAPRVAPGAREGAFGGVPRCAGDRLGLVEEALQVVGVCALDAPWLVRGDREGLARAELEGHDLKLAALTRSGHAQLGPVDLPRPLVHLGPEVLGQLTPVAGRGDDLPVHAIPRRGEPEDDQGREPALAGAVRGTHGHATVFDEPAEDVLLVGRQALAGWKTDEGVNPADGVALVAQLVQLVASCGFQREGCGCHRATGCHRRPPAGQPRGTRRCRLRGRGAPEQRARCH